MVENLVSSSLVSSTMTLLEGMCGLVYLLFAALVCFGIAEVLGFVRPAPGQEPNERWLKRQAKKERRKEEQEEKQGGRKSRMPKIANGLVYVCAFTVVAIAFWFACSPEATPQGATAVQLFFGSVAVLSMLWLIADRLTKIAD